MARRAALRGLASIAIASATTNLLGKRATRRLRPILAGPILAGADPGGERVLRG